MSDWLKNALDAVRALPVAERAAHFFSLLENEVHHGLGVSNLRAVTSELVGCAPEVHAALGESPPSTEEVVPKGRKAKDEPA